MFAALIAGCQPEPATLPSPSSDTQEATAVPDEPLATVIFLGDSITAGYGLEPDEKAYPAVLQDRADSLEWPVRMVNAGLSGETSAGGLRRAGWILKQPVDIMVIELGGNDGLRGLPVGALRENLQGIIDQTRDAHPAAQIILAGMHVPPNMGPDYARDFHAVFAELAASNSTGLIPFILDRVGGIAELNQPDGIHPTAAGQRLVAETVWETLQPVLESVLDEKGCLPEAAGDAADHSELCPVTPLL